MSCSSLRSYIYLRYLRCDYLQEQVNILGASSSAILQFLQFHSFQFSFPTCKSLYLNTPSEEELEELGFGIATVQRTHVSFLSESRRCLQVLQDIGPREASRAPVRAVYRRNSVCEAPMAPVAMPHEQALLSGMQDRSVQVQRHVRRSAEGYLSTIVEKMTDDSLSSWSNNRSIQGLTSWRVIQYFHLLSTLWYRAGARCSSCIRAGFPQGSRFNGKASPIDTSIFLLR